MFKILGLMILGIIIGYGLRRISFLRKVEVSISYTVFLLLFVLGVTIGSNRLIVDNLFSFGWQAALLALSATVGSILDRKSTRLNSSHPSRSRMPSSA